MTLYKIIYTDKQKHLHTLLCRSIYERNVKLSEIHKQGYQTITEDIKC